MKIKKNKVMHNLHDEMEKHYIDPDGKILPEAIDLGMLHLKFISEIHQAKEIMFTDGKPEAGIFIDDFYLSLVTESLHHDALKANRDNINAQIASVEAVSKPVAEHLRMSVFSTFSDILDNKMFQYPTCNLMFRLFIVNAVKNIMLAYIFMSEAVTQNDDSKKFLAYANFHCVNDILDYIAFACNVDLKNYTDMGYQSQLYTHQTSKKLAQHLSEKEWQKK